MKFLNYLKEDYVANITGEHWGTKKIREVFSNPTSKELRDLKKNNEHVRFIINFKSKDIFIWDADIVHFEGAIPLYNMKLISSIQAFGIGGDFGTGFWKDHFAGIGEIIGNKIKYTGYSDTYHDTPDPKGWIGKDQKWLDRFFTEPFIPTVRNDFGYL